MDLEKDFVTEEVNGDGAVVGVNGPAEEDLIDYKFKNQADDFSKTLGDSDKVKNFFDFMPFRVFLPWLRALTDALNALKGDTKSTVAELEKKIGDGYDAIDERVENLEENIDVIGSQVNGLEEKVGEGYGAIDKRVQKIENEVVSSAEEATVNANEAADRANEAAKSASDVVGAVDEVTARAEAALATVKIKDAAQSIVDLNGGRKYLWEGTKEKFSQDERSLPDGAICFVTNDDFDAQIIEAVKKIGALIEYLSGVDMGYADGKITVDPRGFDYFVFEADIGGGVLYKCEATCNGWDETAIYMVLFEIGDNAEFRPTDGGYEFIYEYSLGDIRSVTGYRRLKKGALDNVGS